MRTETVNVSTGWEHRLKHHLGAITSINKNTFTDFLSTCGIRDLGDLNFNQALMFVVARNVYSIISDLPIPAGERPSEDDVIWKLGLPQETQRGRQGGELHDSKVPNEYMDFGMIEGPDELPLIHRDQFLLMRVAKLEFLRRLSARELSRDVFQEHSPTGKKDDGENDNEISEAESLDEKDTVPKAHCLLDISESMNKKDRRSLIARGVQIAFMHSAYSRGQKLHFRPFNSEVGYLTSGDDLKTLATITQRVLRIRNNGTTSFQKALEQASLDTSVEEEKKPSRVDILLITDGESRVVGRPQGDAKLHSIVIGDPVAEREHPRDKADAENNLRDLSEISESFKQIDQDNFQKFLIPNRVDLLSLYIVLESVPQELSAVVTEEEAARIANRIQIAKALIEAYKYGVKEDDKDDEFTEALEEMVDSYLEDLAAKSIEERVEENREKAVNGALHAREEFERLCGPSDSTLPDEKIDESRKDRRKRRKAAGGKDGKPSIPPYIRKIWDILVSVKRWIWK